MDESELIRLLDVASKRPLLEALTVRKGPRAGEQYAKVRDEVRERLEAFGRERALIYKTLVLTGLRKGELASLTAGQLYLDGPVPYAALAARDEKNREGNDIALTRRPGGRPCPMARLQARSCPNGSQTPWRADPGATTRRNARFQPAGRPTADSQSRHAAGRDPQARRAGPDARLARPAYNLWHPDEPGRSGTTNGTSCDASFRHQADYGGLHRPETARRSRALDALPSLPLAGVAAESAKLTGTMGEGPRSLYS